RALHDALPFFCLRAYVLRGWSAVTASPRPAPPCRNLPVVVGCSPSAAGGGWHQKPRGPESPRRCWGLWIAGRWPTFILQIPGGEAVRGIRRSPACPRTVPPTRGDRKSTRLNSSHVS